MAWLSMCEWIGVEGWMRPLGTWEGAAATDGRARDGFPHPSPSSPSSTIFLSPYLTPPSAHPLRLDICRDRGTGGPVKFFLTV